MKQKNVIEINGKIYDARSGKLVKEPSQKTPAKSAAPKEAVKKLPIKKPASPQKFIDGVQRIKNQPAKATAPVKKSSNTSKAAPRAASKTRQKAANFTQKVQRSTTLHRKGLLSPHIEVESKPSSAALEPHKDIAKRLEHALKIQKSSIVSRFSTSRPQAVSPSEKKEPESVDSKKPTHQKTPSATSEKAESTPKKPLHNPAKSQHKKRRSYRKHVSIAGYASTALAVVVLAAYITYLNVPSLSMKVAAARAGFPATMPHYQPSGYSFNGPIHYERGRVTIDFRSNSDSRAFSISQQPTNWDSETLKQSVEKEDKNQFTWQNGGLTFYFTNGQARWVNAGKLYTLDTKGSQLEVSQITQLAASM